METRPLGDLRNVWEPMQGIDQEKRSQWHEDRRYGERLGPAIRLAVAEEDQQDVADHEQEIAEMQLRQDAQQYAGEDQPSPVPADSSAQTCGSIHEGREQ